MLSKLRSKKGTKGFTLIELMIVVAIIGILAAIAIPNFLKFQAKSKTSEAKTNLKGIYTAQASYYGEFGTFANFQTINWVPVGRILIYGYSLDGSISGAQVANQTITGTGVLYSPSATLRGTQSWTATGNYAYLGTMTPILDNTGQAFIAGAAGDVSPRNPLADCWVINDNNSLINTQDGV